MTERELAELVGLSVVEVKMIRQGLTRGSDFFHEPGKAVTYSEAGVAAVLKACGLEKTAISPTEATGPAPEQKNAATVATARQWPDVTKAKVVRIYPNRQWVKCWLPAKEEPGVIHWDELSGIRVFVLNNLELRQKQVIEVAHEDEDRYCMLNRNGIRVRRNPST